MKTAQVPTRMEVKSEGAFHQKWAVNHTPPRYHAGMISKRWNSWTKLRLGFTAFGMALLFAGCNPSADQTGTLDRVDQVKAPAKRPKISQVEKAKEARRIGEELFSTLGLSRTNFAFDEDILEEKAIRPDSRKEAILLPVEEVQTALAERLAWNKKSLGEIYAAQGRKDAGWDEAAQKTLELFAEVRSLSQTTTKKRAALDVDIAKTVQTAFDAGCRDPMIRYLNLRFHGTPGENGNSRGAILQEQTEIADAMEQSAYPPIRKFYSRLRALEKLKELNRVTQAPASDEMESVRMLERCLGHLRDVLQDSTTPRDEAYDAVAEFLVEVDAPTDIRGAHFMAVYDLLLKHHGKSGLAAYFKGDFYIELAWSARGSDWAYKVTDEGWKLFAQRLAVASAALNESWDLNPSDWRTAKRMLTVELGQGQGRPRMERWFRKAMKLNPNSYATVKAKLNYLEPKWYGSEQAMLSFGRECLESDWGGLIPYLTVHAHERAAYYRAQNEDLSYWNKPIVWKECQKAFDKLFRMDADTSGYQHNYALIAYRCGQYEEFERQRKLLQPINYSYFGGRQAYQTMVTNAAAQLERR